MPNDPWEGILAQDAALSTLARALDTDRVASAYLFAGPSGVGKEKAARALAEALVAGTDSAARERIRTETHPDVRVFRPRDEGNRNIQVEFLRAEVLPFAQFAPFEAGAACVIFPEADVSFPPSHPESANALLKTLEEPKPQVHFILLAERPDRLLPTIRSRCQTVPFCHLPPEVIDRILQDRGVPDEERAPAVALAAGRADRALLLTEEGTGRLLLDLALRIDRAVEEGKPGSLIDLAEELARTDRLELALDTLATYYRDVACAALGLDDETLAFRHVADEIRRRAAALDAFRASTRVERIRRAADSIERNANPQIALDSLLYQL
jgi:DNA polymerase-3 subunit delta'